MPKRSARTSLAIIGLLSILGCHNKKSTADDTSVDKAEAATTKTVPPTHTYDGPFGLKPGLSVSEIEQMGFKKVAGQSSVFEGVPPKPIEGVSEYALLATPHTGLCRVRARLAVPVVNGRGDQVRSEVDRLAALMAIKYGEHTLKGDISEDVHKRNPQFWMVGLLDKSVMYGYVWNTTKTKSISSHQITNIEVIAEAASVDRGLASLTYTFDTFDACSKENQARDAANL